MSRELTRQEKAAIRSLVKRWCANYDKDAGCLPLDAPCYKLAEHGIACSGHAARQLTQSDYKEFDLLIGMDQANLRNMCRICGGDPDGKIHLLLDYTGHPRDVADPWYTDDFEATWQDVLAGCQGLLQELLQK